MSSEHLPLITRNSDNGFKSKKNKSYSSERITDLHTDFHTDLQSDLQTPCDLYLTREIKHPTSNTDTLIHFLKANIGTGRVPFGILAMPLAFKDCGLYFGLIGTLVLGFICTHSMLMLLGCSRALCSRLHIPSMDFADVAYYAFKTGPYRLQKHCDLARKIINFFLCVTQIGFCCVYFVFVADNMKEIVDHYFIKLDVRIYLLLLLIPMILLNFLKNLKYLVPVSLCAWILSVAGLAIIFYYLLQDLPSTQTVKQFSSWNQLPLYFATAIYAFEGVGIVLPLENNMENPDAFGGPTGVLITGMTITAALYTAMGFFGYLKYGDGIKASITLNLYENPTLAELVRVMFAVAIFLSCALQYYIPLEILGPWARKKFSQTKHVISDGVLRVALVLITFVLAIIVPKLGPIISLIGAFGSSSLGLIFPPVLEILTFGIDGMGPLYWKLWKNTAIICLGILSMVFGTYASFLELMKSDT